MAKNRLVMAFLAAAVLGGGGYVAWKWATTGSTTDQPPIPTISLDGADPAVVEAVSSAVQAVRDKPSSATSWGILAMVLNANGFYEPAMECYAQAERHDPRNPAWPYLHGRELVRVRPRDGLPLLLRALDLAAHPDRAAILFRLALVLIDDGQLAEAEQHLAALAEIESDSEQLRFARGLLAIARKDSANAQQHLRPLVDSRIAGRRACLLLASLRIDDSRIFEQKAAGKPADEPWPDPFDAEMRRYKVEGTNAIAQYHRLKNQGLQQDALNYLWDHAKRSPDAEVCIILGFELYAIGQFEDAEKMLREALRFDDRNVKTYTALADIVFRRAEQRHREPGGKEAAAPMFREAVTFADRAVALQFNVGMAHLTRGRALWYLERPDEAVQALRQAVLIQPEASDMHLALGETLAQSGKLPEALEHLQDAVKLARPDDPRPRQALEKWQKRR